MMALRGLQKAIGGVSGGEGFRNYGNMPITIGGDSEGETSRMILRALGA